MKPHIYAELIKAWADGAEIELKHNGKWIDAGQQITWYECNEYRLKPQPKPDNVVEKYICYDSFKNNYYAIFDNKPNIRIIFHGETGNIKKIEVLR